jgi:hypothetical protein
MLFTLCGLTAYAQTKADSIDISKYEQYIEDDGNLLDADGIIKPLGIFTTTEISREVIDSILIREGYTIERQKNNYYNSYSYFLQKNNYKEIKEYCVNISNQENPSARIHWFLKLYDAKIHTASLKLGLCKNSKGKNIKGKKIIKSLLNYYKEKGAEIRKYKKKETYPSGKKIVYKGYELIYNGHYMRLYLNGGPVADIDIVYNCNEYYRGIDLF